MRIANLLMIPLLSLFLHLSSAHGRCDFTLRMRESKTAFTGFVSCESTELGTPVHNDLDAKPNSLKSSVVKERGKTVHLRTFKYG